MGFTKTSNKGSAQLAADVLDKVGPRHGFRARAKKLADDYYVVTRTGDVARAYHVSDIDLAAVRADYLAWRRAAKPEESLTVAIHYFMAHRPAELVRHDDTAILTGEQRFVLDRRASGKGNGPDLSPDQVEVLEIAKRLGFAAE
jgi:hypothetical protein